MVEGGDGVVGLAAGEGFGSVLVEAFGAGDGLADVGLVEAALEFGVGDMEFVAEGEEGDAGVEVEGEECVVVVGEGGGRGHGDDFTSGLGRGKGNLVEVREVARAGAGCARNP